MLSDAAAQLRDRLLPIVNAIDAPELFITLRLIEMEARHMEMTIEYLTGRPHAPLDGQLMFHPAIATDFERLPEC